MEELVRSPVLADQKLMGWTVIDDGSWHSWHQTGHNSLPGVGLTRYMQKASSDQVSHQIRSSYGIFSFQTDQIDKPGCAEKNTGEVDLPQLPLERGSVLFGK